MTLYSFILLIHVTAVLILTAALSFEVLSLLYLRGASTAAEARPWLDPVPKLPVFAGAALLVILCSGIYLVTPMSKASQAWPHVAVASLFLMGPFGAITARRMRAVRRAYRSSPALNPELLEQLRDPFLKTSLALRIAVFLGIFLLVSTKPGLWESIGLVGAFAALGLLSSLLAWRRRLP
ncbi:MAG: hypothetical protein LAO79_20110 [Acidobacteriia bacterium]|nr:hypothetical protein [Terriglobia bacterium]